MAVVRTYVPRFSSQFSFSLTPVVEHTSVDNWISPRKPVLCKILCERVVQVTERNCTHPGIGGIIVGFLDNPVLRCWVVSILTSETSSSPSSTSSS